MHNTTFTDIYTCYVLFRKELIDADELGTSGWEQHAEILSRLARSANSIYEVPISYFGRTYEEGKKIRAVHAIAVARTIITERLRPLSNRKRERRRELSVASCEKQTYDK